MSILSRYTIKEILSHLAGVLVIVLTIFMVRQFADFLSDAADGTLPSGVLMHLLGLRTVMALPSLLPVGFYVAVLLGMGRLYEDKEMTALSACGVPAKRIHATVALVSICAAVVAAGVSFWARPWAAVAFHAVRDQATRQAGIGQLSPGRFYELTNETEQAVFAETRSAADPRFVENVFVQLRDGDKISVLYAARAAERVDTDQGYRFLELLDGYRYDLGSEAGSCDITEYEKLTIRTPLDAATPGSTQDHSLSAAALARSSNPEDWAELQWRLAAPISSFLLGLLAIALSRISPDQGRYTRLFIAILLYVAYSQVLSMVKKWVANGVWAPWPGTWMVHGLCLAAVVGLFAAESVDDFMPWRWMAPVRWSARAKSSSGAH